MKYWKNFHLENKNAIKLCLMAFWGVAQLNSERTRGGTENIRVFPPNNPNFLSEELLIKIISSSLKNTLDHSVFFGSCMPSSCFRTNVQNRVLRVHDINSYVVKKPIYSLTDHIVYQNMTFVNRKKVASISAFSCFGVSLNTQSREKIMKKIRFFLEKETVFHRISTVGPEFLLRAKEDIRFKKNILKADMRISDGYGITIAGWIWGVHIPRYPGADLLRDILKEAEIRNFSVFVATRKDSLSSFKDIQKSLLKKYPRLKIEGNEYADMCDYQFSFPPVQIVFCNFGAPEQEYFLEALREQAKSVKLAMGVGGAFDFLTGKLPRAPIFFRALGFEWLWRLFLQPKRWKRIWRAVIIFPFLVLKERFLK